jgi:hypothetical protein
MRLRPASVLSRVPRHAAARHLRAIVSVAKRSSGLAVVKPLPGRHRDHALLLGADDECDSQDERPVELIGAPQLSLPRKGPLFERSEVREYSPRARGVSVSVLCANVERW